MGVSLTYIFEGYTYHVNEEHSHSVMVTTFNLMGEKYQGGGEGGGEREGEREREKERGGERGGESEREREG